MFQVIVKMSAEPADECRVLHVTDGSRLSTKEIVVNLELIVHRHVVDQRDDSVPLKLYQSVAKQYVEHDKKTHLS